MPIDLKVAQHTLYFIVPGIKTSGHSVLYPLVLIKVLRFCVNSQMCDRDLHARDRDRRGHGHDLQGSG